MMPYLQNEFGNPSSIYSYGRNAKRAIEDSRDKIAKVLNCGAEEIVFTGSGTEANNIAIRGVAHSNKHKGNHIITSRIEHPSVLETFKDLGKEGFDVSYIGVNEKRNSKFRRTKKCHN